MLFRGTGKRIQEQAKGIYLGDPCLFFWSGYCHRESLACVVAQIHFGFDNYRDQPMVTDPKV
jgi:hypothetical protein